MLRAVALLALLSHSPSRASGADPEVRACAAKRALEDRLPFIPAFWRAKAVESAWKQWELREKPADYAAQLQRALRPARCPLPQRRAADGPAQSPVHLGRWGGHRLHGLPRQLAHGQELRGAGQQQPRRARALRGAGQGERRQCSAAVRLFQRPRHFRGGGLRRLLARLPQSGPHACAPPARISACMPTCARMCPRGGS